MTEGLPGTVVSPALQIERAGSGGVCVSKGVKERVSWREDRQKEKKMTVAVFYNVWSCCS